MEAVEKFTGVPLPRAVGVKLTTTSATAVYTAVGGNVLEAVDWLIVSNTDSTDRTVTIAWYDSSETTAYSVATGTTIPANTSLTFRLGFTLSASDEIRCTAATANTLEVIAQIVEMGRAG